MRDRSRIQRKCDHNRYRHSITFARFLHSVAIFHLIVICHLECCFFDIPRSAPVLNRDITISVKKPVSCNAFSQFHTKSEHQRNRNCTNLKCKIRIATRITCNLDGINIFSGRCIHDSEHTAEGSRCLYHEESDRNTGHESEIYACSDAPRVMRCRYRIQSKGEEWHLREK